MSRVSRILLVAVVAVMAAPAAMAQLVPARVAAATKAADSFVERAKGSSEPGARAPRESDPAVKALLDAVFDTGALAPDRTLPFSDLTALSQWLNAVLKVGTVYLVAGTGTTDISKADAKMVDRNTVDYAPETGRYLDAQLRVSTAMIRMVVVTMAAQPKGFEQPNVKKGLDQMRAGTTLTLEGTLEIFRIAGVQNDWRRSRLPALAEIAPWAAKFVPAEDARKLRDLALRVAQAMDDQLVRDRLNAFATAVAPP